MKRTDEASTGHSADMPHRGMKRLRERLRPLVAYAALFSVCINVLLLVPSLYMIQVFDRVIASRSSETLVVLTLAAAGAIAVMAALDALRARLLATGGAALDAMLGPRVLHGLLAGAARLGGAEYVHGMRDAATLRGFASGTGMLALFDAPWLPVYIAVIFLFHPLLGAVATAGAAALVGLAALNERLTRAPLDAQQAAARTAMRYADASLRNAHVVGALGMERAVSRRWAWLNDAAQREQVRAARLAANVGGASKLLRQGLQVAMLAAGAYLVIEQHVTGGVMMAATIILGRALAPVESLIASWRSLVEAQGAWRRLDALLASRASDRDATALPAPRGALCAERVYFSPGPGDKAILKGVSLELAPGESLSLIGPSASGKSTLARVLLGVWAPTSGTVRLDGADVASWPRRRLGPHLGYLPQDVELFSGTVAENIARFGKPDPQAVVAAAHRANAHEMILQLPQGYDTEIGEGGTALSGGQRQRIGLARALYGRPRIVVLDEPNANLDAEGEAALMQAMNGLRREGVTLIAISHRPSVLAGVDKLLVLKDGAVAAFGPRDAVMGQVTPGSGAAAMPLRAVQGGSRRSA